MKLGKAPSTITFQIEAMFAGFEREKREAEEVAARLARRLEQKQSGDSRKDELDRVYQEQAGRVLALLAHGPWRHAELLKALGLSDSIVVKILGSLRDAGKVDSTGTRKNRLYSLAAKR